MGLWRPVPGQHLHARSKRDAGGLCGNAAEAKQADGLAGQFHALVAQPVAGAHLAVHLGEAPRTRPHQRDGAFGDRGVAIAADQVHLDAEPGELLDMHVAARAGAEKHDVLEVRALLCDLGRQVGVIDDGDFGAVEHFRQLRRRDVGIAVDLHRDVAVLSQAFHDERQLFAGIDEYGAHGMPFPYFEATPVSANTVCSSTLAPAAQSSCVEDSSSLWLMPSLQGTNTIDTGITVLRLQAS